MSTIEPVLERTKEMGHVNNETIPDEANTVKIVLYPVAIILTFLFLFSVINVINYFALKARIERLTMDSLASIQRGELSQKVNSQGFLLSQKAVSPNKLEDSKKETKEKSSPLQKPQKTEFTIQVGAFRNAQYAKSLAARLDEQGYKVHIATSEEQDVRLFKVSVGNFSNRQEAESLSKKIMGHGDLQTFIALY